MNNSQIRCLLVDDEPPSLEILRTYISTVPMLKVVGECYHAMGAFEYIQRHAVDVIFLDVNMPRLSGIDFIKALPNPPKVIFTTAHRDFAVEGFELGAIDYLLKPYSLDRFLRAVHRMLNPDSKNQKTSAASLTEEKPDRFLYVRADRKMVKVFIDDITHIESLKDYVKVVTTNKIIVSKQSISSLEEMLPRDSFIRVHRSYILAVNKIDTYNTDLIEVGGKEIPIGRLFRHEVNKVLSISSLKNGTPKQSITPRDFTGNQNQ